MSISSDYRNDPSSPGLTPESCPPSPSHFKISISLSGDSSSQISSRDAISPLQNSTPLATHLLKLNSSAPLVDFASPHTTPEKVINQLLKLKSVYKKSFSVAQKGVFVGFCSLFIAGGLNTLAKYIIAGAITSAGSGVAPILIAFSILFFISGTSGLYLGRASYIKGEDIKSKFATNLIITKERIETMNVDIELFYSNKKEELIPEGFKEYKRLFLSNVSKENVEAEDDVESEDNVKSKDNVFPENLVRPDKDTEYEDYIKTDDDVESEDCVKSEDDVESEKPRYNFLTGSEDENDIEKFKKDRELLAKIYNLFVEPDKAVEVIKCDSPIAEITGKYIICQLTGILIEDHFKPL